MNDALGMYKSGTILSVFIYFKVSDDYPGSDVKAYMPELNVLFIIA